MLFLWHFAVIIYPSSYCMGVCWLVLKLGILENICWRITSLGLWMGIEWEYCSVFFSVKYTVSRRVTGTEIKVAWMWEEQSTLQISSFHCNPENENWSLQLFSLIIRHVDWWKEKSTLWDPIMPSVYVQWFMFWRVQLFMGKDVCFVFLSAMSLVLVYWRHSWGKCHLDIFTSCECLEYFHNILACKPCCFCSLKMKGPVPACLDCGRLSSSLWASLPLLPFLFQPCVLCLFLVLGQSKVSVLVYCIKLIKISASDYLCIEVSLPWAKEWKSDLKKKKSLKKIPIY